MIEKMRRFEKHPSEKKRVLMFSQRNIFSNIHYRLGLYEFEDIICQVDSVNLMAPRPKRWFEYGDRIANRVASDYGILLNPGIPKIELNENYDLFFAIAQFPKDLLHLNSLKNWKEKCRISICWLNELWITEIKECKNFLKILSQFDYVIVHSSGSLNAIQEIIKVECHHLPYGINAIFFCPYPNMAQRVIDVYSIGRKSLTVHETLMRLMENNKFFYIYDTIDGDVVYNPNEHRYMFANMIKRSRYFIVNPGRVTRPDLTKGQVEFGNRFFEGAAAGAILIGGRPDNKEFSNYFDWPDAVIDVPFNAKNIDEVIRELDKYPERQREIRKNSIVQSLLRHDWVIRWESVLKIAGLAPLPALEKRKERLRDLSEKVESTMTL